MDERDNKKSNIGLGILLFVAALLFIHVVIRLPSATEIQKNQNEQKELEETETYGDKKRPELWRELEKGGWITFSYNYDPSGKKMRSMYEYVLDNYDGVYKFYCYRYALGRGTETLADCSFSSDVWQKLLELVLEGEILEDVGEKYVRGESGGNKTYPKILTINRKHYSSGNSSEIEEFFYNLALQAGVDEEELHWDKRVDDAIIENKAEVTNLHGDFVVSEINILQNEEKEKLEKFLRSKYEETGIRMYLLLSDTSDEQALLSKTDELLARATSPGMVFGLTATQDHWVFRFRRAKDHETQLKERYKEIGDVYNKVKTSLYDKLEAAVNKAYRLYENEDDPSAVLVAYFSCTGTTKGVAEKIAAITGANLYEIEAEETYTEEALNWKDAESRTTMEQNDPDVRPGIKGEAVNLDGYQVIFIGYPIWWGQEPRIMDTFVEKYDFEGITLIPFCTSDESGIGESGEKLEAIAGSGTWLEGARFGGGESEEELREWIQSMISLETEEEVTEEVTEEATGDATGEATEEVTEEVTEDATEETAGEASDEEAADADLTD